MSEANFLVVGSGVAGLRAAVELADYGMVWVITKAKVENSSTWSAQGGIAVAFSEGDTPEDHIRDTLEAGAGLCDEKAVGVLVEEGVDRVKELINWGANFDKVDGEFSFTLEGAHRIRRIIHAMGDATGEELHNTLMHKASGIKNIRFLENTFLVDLLVKGDRCSGAVVLDSGGNMQNIFVSAVVLATGGVGGIFKDTTNPESNVGDGIAAAYRAGAELRDMEFVQFHPTTLYLKGAPCFLISESVRGEGGILKDSNKKAFMKEFHEMGDLAPRDVVCRAISKQLRETGNESVYLDATHMDSGFLKKRFPNIYTTCRKYGVDITKDIIPVKPSAHFLMGGIKTNLDGETNIKRLFSCGESASVGVHGANRLASNSLLEGLVFGKRAGCCAGACAGTKEPEVDLLPTRKATGNPDVQRQKERLRGLMEAKAGLVRCGGSLKKALKTLKKYGEIAILESASQEEYELRNMAAVGSVIAQLALEREESRGAHFRSDFPDTNDKEWKRHSIIRSQEAEDRGDDMQTKNTGVSS